MKLILIIFLFSQVAYGQSELRTMFFTKIPAELRSLKPGQKRDDVLKILGRPDKSQNNTDYYQKTFKKYDTAVAFEQNEVKSIYYHFRPADFKYDDLKHLIKPQDIDKAKSEIQNRASRKVHLITLDYPKLGLKILLNNNSALTVKAIIWSKEES